MHFEAYPPEVNSANIYAGPGPDSMLAAARAWRSLDVEMTAVQRSFNRTLLSLMDAWAGPVVMQLMEAAAVCQVADRPCVQLSEVERQIHEIVRAYEWAHHDMVPWRRSTTTVLRGRF